MPVELNFLKNMMIRKFQLHSSHTQSTKEQEAYGVYYAVTKWKYYLQGSDIIVCNEHKPLQKFLNGINTSNKVTDGHWNLPLTISN